MLSLIVSQELLMSTSASTFYKAANLSETSTWYCSLLSISFNFLRLNLSIWNLCELCSFTASLSLNSGHYHNLLPWMIEHQVHSNAFAYLPAYSQSDCGYSHLETSKYIYGCCDVETSYFWLWGFQMWQSLLLKKQQKNKLHGMSPRANYTDRAIAACRRSDCQLLRIEGATWSAWRIPTAIFSVF
jgi:hypothetical protein